MSRQSHAAASEPKQIAILGGGITGLTATYYASKRFPNATITLFESTHRLGGVIDSVHTKVGNGSMVCETGTRTLRANAPRAIVTLDLVSPPSLQKSTMPGSLCARVENTPPSHFPFYSPNTSTATTTN